MSRPCTQQARRIWKHLFPGEPWPRGWKVVLGKPPTGYVGWCSRFHQLITLLDTHPFVVKTLCHEFVHLRCRGLRHGKEFNAIVHELVERIGLISHPAASLS